MVEYICQSCKKIHQSKIDGDAHACPYCPSSSGYRVTPPTNKLALPLLPPGWKPREKTKTIVDEPPGLFDTTSLTTRSENPT